MNIIDAARSYLAAKLSAIPIRADGSKAPALGEWKPYGSSPISDKDIKRLFRDGLGIAILGGRVSGNLEILDFDRPGVFDEWRSLVDADAPGLIDRLPLIETPDGGRHLYYRCEEISGPMPALAKSRAPFRKASGKLSSTIIETKGEGGYVLAPPSPAECHPNNRPYMQIAGPALPEIPRIAVAERRIMLAAARSFNEVPDTVVNEPVPPSGVTRPGDIFNDKSTWPEILEPHGWVRERSRGEVTYWKRPGKQERGASATTGHCGELLYVFSTSAAPFDGGHAYSRFAAHALLNHGGDYAQAAKYLAANGYAPKAEKSQAVNAIEEKRKLRFFTYTELKDIWHGQRTDTRIETGIGELDLAIGGGLPVGQVTTVIGGTGVGKSEFLRQIRKNIAEAGYLVVHVDVELGAKRVVDRDVSQISEIPSSWLHREDLSDGQMSSIADAFMELCELPILTIPCLGAPPIDELANVIAEAIASKRNGKPVAVFLDSGQRLAAGIGVDDQRLRNQGFWEWAEALAKSHDVAVMVTSEQKRSQAGGKPDAAQLLHSGAESRAIEFTSDVVLGLIEENTPSDMEAKTADTESLRPVRILIAKVRDGTVGYLSHEVVFSAPCWDMQVRERDDDLSSKILATIPPAGGSPIGAETIAKKLKAKRKSVRNRCREMAQQGYIEYHTLGGRGLGYTLRNQLAKRLAGDPPRGESNGESPEIDGELRRVNSDFDDSELI